MSLNPDAIRQQFPSLSSLPGWYAALPEIDRDSLGLQDPLPVGYGLWRLII